MKPALLSAIIILLCFVSCSSNEHEFDINASEVPKDVMAAFKAKYPSAEVVKWQAEKENGHFYFEAEIKEGDKEKDIRIAPDGSSVTEED
jgi:hypothetical protein